MTARPVNRRRLVGGIAAIGTASIVIKSVEAAEYRFVQYHNQAVTSALHRRLVEMWDTVRRETNGRVETEVFAENNKISGSDPAALNMLVDGKIQFFTLMGGILGNVVAAAEVQQVPFSFRTAHEAHAAMDGALGRYLCAEMAGKGIYGFTVGAFDNGMRQISCSTHAVIEPADLAGVKIRIPAGQMANDTFSALGAEPVAINVNGLYDALKTGRVEAQENPLAIIELFRLYEVQRYISMTNHMWSGFNQMAHLPTWNSLPATLQEVIERQLQVHVRLQRKDQATLNASLRDKLGQRGLEINDVDPTPFRSKLSGVYAKWKDKLGSKCWSLLEESTGQLG